MPPKTAWPNPPITAIVPPMIAMIGARMPARCARPSTAMMNGSWAITKAAAEIVAAVPAASIVSRNSTLDSEKAGISAMATTLSTALRMRLIAAAART